MIHIDITLDKAGLKGLEALGAKGNVATAKALTFTAQDSQRLLQQTLPSYFHLRNSWVYKGIRITPANGGKLVAQVGSVDKYMERHVVAKHKDAASGLAIRSSRDSRGRYGSGGLLIPRYGSIGNMPTHTAIRSRFRRYEGNKRKPFHIRHGGSILIVRRRTNKRYPLETLGVLQAGAGQSKIWPMFELVTGVVFSRFGGHFLRAMAAAK